MLLHAILWLFIITNYWFLGFCVDHLQPQMNATVTFNVTTVFQLFVFTSKLQKMGIYCLEHTKLSYIIIACVTLLSLTARKDRHANYEDRVRSNLATISRCR